MRNLKLLLLMFLLFFGKIGFSQNTVKYSSLSTTIDLNSGVEGTVDILVNCYGDSSTPVYLNALQSCADNDGILSTSYTNGNKLTPGKNTTIRYKFKKTLTTNTQIAYKFSTNGSCYQKESEMIKITVNYKAGSTTTPPGTIPPEMIYIGGPGGTISTTINEGDKAPVISGTGQGKYTYQWYQSINGYVTPISGATNFYYYPGTPFVTTKYFRENKLGSVIVNSNEITITVINNAPPISNNTITTRDDGIVIGNGLPTGGLGGNSYRYDWFITDEDGESVKLYSETSEYVSFTQSKFDYFRKSAYNFKIRRLVYSGSQVSISNYVDMPHFSDIQNNIISLNGHNVTGSIPTGGMGDYTYSWALVPPGGYIELDETTKDLDLTSHPIRDSSTVLIRIVTAGISSMSNKLDVNGITAKALNKENTVVSAIYPNPTSGSVNFTTNFSNNKEMEIIVYSEKLRNTLSVFKGTATPNQIVKWDIPSNYPKGIYYYKIISDNKEVKTGKILYQ
jgi:hypothetical protein